MIMKHLKTFMLMFVLIVAWIAIIAYLKTQYKNQSAMDIISSVGTFFIGFLVADIYLINKKD